MFRFLFVIGAAVAVKISKHADSDLVPVKELLTKHKHFDQDLYNELLTHK